MIRQGFWMLAPVAIVMAAPSVAVAEVNARVEIGATLVGSSVTAEEVERRASARDRARLAQIAEQRTGYEAALAVGDARVAESGGPADRGAGRVPGGV